MLDYYKTLAAITRYTVYHPYGESGANGYTRSTPGYEIPAFGTDSMVWTCWFKDDNAQYGQCLACLGANNSYGRVSKWLNPDDYRFFTNANVNATVAALIPNDHEWFHVGIFLGTNVFRLYINGEYRAVHNGANDAAHWRTTNWVNVIHNNHALNTAASGWASDNRMFRLPPDTTATEAQRIIRDAMNFYDSEPKPLLHWKLSEEPYSYAKDSSGNDLRGTYHYDPNGYKYNAPSDDVPQ